MSFASSLATFLRERCGGQPRAISLATASWPLSIALEMPADEIARELRDELVGSFPASTIMLPVFTKGFDEDGFRDLDGTTGTTGVINEYFRTSPGFRRTHSAFFSFAVSGPDAAELVALRPEFAWGDGSLYAWMFEQDVDLVTVGLHPTHTSFAHYSEWRMQVPYRFNKQFTGKIRIEGAIEPIQETLFVRQRHPVPRNDFTRALPALTDHGLLETNIGSIRVSHVTARAMTAALIESLSRDCYALLKNP
jgi:aminoglycoside 3-N-acetyltransferase